MVKVPFSRQEGFTFIEVVVFIVVTSIALVGVLALYQQATARSADTIVSKQAMEAGYAMLAEIQAMPFTYCDLSDPVAATATSPSSCSSPQGLTPQSGKARGSLTAPFNNVGDYGGYSETGIADINGNAVPSLGAYILVVSLSSVAVAGVPSSDSVRIDVTVTGPSGPQTISGYRMRHSPNAMP